MNGVSVLCTGRIGSLQYFGLSAGLQSCLKRFDVALKLTLINSLQIYKQFTACQVTHTKDDSG